MKVIIYIDVTIGTGLLGRRKTGGRGRENEDGRRRSDPEVGGTWYKKDGVLFKEVKMRF